MVWLKSSRRRRPLGINRHLVSIIGPVCLFVSGALTKPIDYFPINSQLPPVARTGTEFSFVFSPITFFSPLPLSYTLVDAPAWLSIASDERRIYGTPTEEDLDSYGSEAVIGIQIVLEAEDETGSATAGATLVVSRNAEPEIALPLSQQIENLGDEYSPPSSLLFEPSSDFSFSFSEDTFFAEGLDDGASLNYYAVSSDWAPLPSWVNFDAGTLTFAGTTPPFETLVQPPQRFGLRLVASDVTGFSAASIEFIIVVGVHELTSDEPVVQINATRDERLMFDELSELLKLDDQPLKPENVSTIDAFGLPGWLDFDSKTWVLMGTPGDDAEAVNVTIAVQDVYVDFLNVTIAIDFNDPIFVSDPPESINATAGQDFLFNLTEHLLDPTEIDVNIETQPHAPWLVFDDPTKLLAGEVPEPFAEDFASVIEVTFEASSNSTGDMATRTMSLHITTSSPEAPPPGEPEDNGPGRNLLWLLLPAILLLCVGFILLLFWLRHRKRRLRSLSVGDVSAPVPGSFVNNNGSGSLGGTSTTSDIRKMVDIGPFLPEIGAAGLAGGRHSVARRSNLRVSETLSEPSSGEQYPEGTALAYNPDRAPFISGAIGRPLSNMLPHILERRSVSEDERAESSQSVSPISSSNQTHPSGRGPAGSGTDDQSLWSDTSLGDAESHLATMVPVSLLNKRKTVLGDTFRDTRLGLELPEPSSIQPTPELAYRVDEARKRADQANANLAATLSPRTPAATHLSPQPNHGLGLRPVGHRYITSQHDLQKDQQQLQQVRNSDMSVASDASTTRTSILAMGFTEQQQQQYYQPQRSPHETASIKSATSLMARPTIVHIPSRPGEPRVVSRQSNTSSVAGGVSGQPSPLFGGRSPSRPRQRHTNTLFGLLGAPNSPTPAIHEADEEEQDDRGAAVISQPPPAITDPSLAAGSRESDSSWDRFARNSLGIAYKDLIRTHANLPSPKRQSPIRSAEPRMSYPTLNIVPPADDDYPSDILEEEVYQDLDDDDFDDSGQNWKVYQHTSQELMSPDRWPQPGRHRVTENPYDKQRASKIGVALTPTFRESWNRNPLAIHAEPVSLSPEPVQVAQVDSETVQAAVHRAQQPQPPSRPRRSHFREARSSPSFTSRSSASSMSTTSTRRDSNSTNYRPQHHRGATTGSRDERLRLSRLREQRAIDQFRSIMAQRPPSATDENAPLGGGRVGNRPLAQTSGGNASRVSRGPLADRGSNYNNSNNTTSGGGSNRLNFQSVASGKSIRTVKSEWTDIVVYDDDNNNGNNSRNRMTSRTAVDDGGDNDGGDEDAWEDVKPPESAYLGRDSWDYEGSNGSFVAAFI